MTHSENKVESLVTQFRQGNVGRRDFLRKIVAAGVSSAAAYTMLESTASAQQFSHLFQSGGQGPRTPSGPGRRMSTMAVGEEGTPRPAPIPRPTPRPTTQMVGEEGNRITTHAVGEEGQPNPRPITTQAIGEEGQPNPRPVTTRAHGEECKPRPNPTTFAVGEEDRPQATTAIFGEEDRPQATTAMVGEEGMPRTGVRIQKYRGASPWQGFKRW